MANASELTFNPAQQNVLEHVTKKAPQLIIGGPGTGKTTLLIEAAAQIAANAKGKKAPQIALICLAYRTARRTEFLLQEKYPELLQNGTVRVVTIKDLAYEALFQAQGGENLHFISNNQVRSLLRKAMEKVEFGGSVTEAEHIIRSFRAQLKNPQPNARNYPLFEAYKELIEERNVVDRHTLIRKHIIGMDNGTVKPAACTHMLVDHIQDVTPIQLRWLLAHQAKNIKLIAAGDDDQTLYKSDGAMGRASLEKIQTLKSAKTETLTQGYRLPKNLAPAIHQVPRLLYDRLGKNQKETNAAGTFTTRNFTDFPSEWAYVVQTIRQLQAEEPHAKIGLIARSQEQSTRLSHLCNVAGLSHAGYFRPVWEQHGAKLTLSALYLFMGCAKPSQLAQVLSALGCSPLVVGKLIQAPEMAHGVGTWLQTGLPLPEFPENSVKPEEIKQLKATRRYLAGTWQSLQKRQMNPQEAFLALMQQCIARLPLEHQQYALLATDMVFHLKGNVREGIEKLLVETLPDQRANLVVTPVRESRNMAFDHIILPMADAQHWPLMAGRVLERDVEDERRLFFTALSRAAKSITCTTSHGYSNFVQEISANVKQTKNPKGK